MSKVPIQFYWRHGGKQVYLTGTFDQWKVSIPMTKESKATDDFVCQVQLDPREKHLFKFVVDGVWRCSGEFPTENDQHGNVNNWRIPVNEPAYKNLVNQLPNKAGAQANSQKVPEKVAVESAANGATKTAAARR